MEAFPASLPQLEQRKVFWVPKLIEDLELVPAEYFKKLQKRAINHVWKKRS